MAGEIPTFLRKERKKNERTMGAKRWRQVKRKRHPAARPSPLTFHVSQKRKKKLPSNFFFFFFHIKTEKCTHTHTHVYKKKKKNSSRILCESSCTSSFSPGPLVECWDCSRKGRRQEFPLTCANLCDLVATAQHSTADTGNWTLLFTSSGDNRGRNVATAALGKVSARPIH